MDPTPRRAAALASHCGAVRVAFNWGLAQVKANLAQREAERSYGLARRSAHPRVVMVDARTA
ncbi:helix-turn-helix domain-containing protein [Nonomuraea diastatica]|uniref:helix-turn-helix domain-containing protein n=1 Tax=Nonomuraea diastatica TaxID=1848329 RepID=UPI003CCC8745